MKKLLIISSVFLSGSLFCNELAWVDEQVEAIKPARTGMSSKALAGTYNPFIFLKKKEEGKKTPRSTKIAAVSSTTKKKSLKKRKQILTLSLIMNDSAKINDGWYKKGDKVNGYEIKRIDSKSVLLTKKKKQLLLSTRSSSKNLKFNNK